MRPGARVRVRQFFSALDARRHPPDSGPARRVLPPDLFALFGRMPPEDRRHGLEVLSILEAQGEVDAPLLQAALLHDVGKAESGVGLPHRILRVLLAWRLPRLWQLLAGWPTGWQRPFWVVTHHPQRGAIWVETLGGDPAVVELIRYHESPPRDEWAGTDLGRWHAALSAADGTC